MFIWWSSAASVMATFAGVGMIMHSPKDAIMQTEALGIIFALLAIANREERN